MEIAATLRERHKEDSIKLNYGSLYTVIESLVDAGFINAKKTTREGNRPERTIYGITPAGEGKMKNWLREIVSTPVKEFPQFEAGLSLLPALPPEESCEMLEVRAELLKKDVEKLEKGIEETKAMKLPSLFVIETEYRLAATKTELAFVTKLIERIDKDGCGSSKNGKNGIPKKRPRTEPKQKEVIHESGKRSLWRRCRGRKILGPTWFKNRGLFASHSRQYDHRSRNWTDVWPIDSDIGDWLWRRPSIWGLVVALTD